MAAGKVWLVGAGPGDHGPLSFFYYLLIVSAILCDSL